MSEKRDTQTRPSSASTAGAGSKRTVRPPRASACRSHRSVSSEEQRVRVARRATPRASSERDYPKEYGGHGHKGFQAIASQGDGARQPPFMINVIGLGMAADDPRARHRGAEAPLPAAAAVVGRDLVPGLLGAGRGSDLGSARRRRSSERATTGSSTAYRCGPASRALRELDDPARPPLEGRSTTAYVLHRADPRHEGRHGPPAGQDLARPASNEVLVEFRRDPRLAAPLTRSAGLDGRDDDAHLRARRGRRAGSGGGTSVEEYVNELIALAKRTKRSAARRGTTRVVRDRSRRSRSAPKVCARTHAACASRRWSTIRCASAAERVLDHRAHPGSVRARCRDRRSAREPLPRRQAP